MAGGGTDLPEVARALEALRVVFDVTATSEARRAATFYVSQLESGDARQVVTVSLPLLQPGRPSEVRHFGCKLLQHVVRNSWQVLGPEERNKLAEMIFDLLKQCATPDEEWALKSKAASLVADVVKQEGPVLWKHMLPAILGIGGTDAAHAEVAAMVLQFIPEDVTVHNDDLDGERRRQLLMALTGTLQEVLPFLFKLLEKHYFTALTVAATDGAAARLHAQVVGAALLAAGSYAEWAPMNYIQSSSLVDGCGALLGSTDFRLSACDFMKRIACRRQPSDDLTGVFETVIEKVASVLIETSSATLSAVLATRSQTSGDGAGELGIDDSAIEFLERLCEAMVALGLNNMAAVAKDEAALRMYMQQMLTFSQLRKTKLLSLAIPFWVTVLRESTSRTGPPKRATTKDKPVHVAVPVEICSALLEACEKSLLKGEEGILTDDDSNVDVVLLRNNLLHVVHYIALLEPLLSSRYSLQRLQEILSHIGSDTMASTSPAVVSAATNQLESIYVFLNEVIKAVAAGAVSSPSILSPELKNTVGVMVTGILSMDWKQPWLIEAQSRLIEALAPCMRYYPGSAQVAMQKLFSFLSVLPVTTTSPAAVDAGDESGLDVTDVRRSICLSVVRLATGAAAALAGHIWPLADGVDQLYRGSQLSAGERCVLGEALLIVGSAAGKDHLAQVLERLLSPVREPWSQLASKDWLRDPQSFAAFLTSQVEIETGSISNELYWIQVTISLFEKAIRRCKWSDAGAVAVERAPVASNGQAVGNVNVMSPHILWILEALLPLIRCVHCLWSPQVRQGLPPLVESAMKMGPVEQAVLLGEVAAQGILPGGQRQSDRAPKFREEKLRKWLKGVRDSVYDFLGAAVSIESFYNDHVSGSCLFDGRRMASMIAEALLSDLSSMEVRHVRLLVHQIAVPLIKACPRSKWEAFLGPLLPPLLIHCRGMLCEQWSKVVADSSARTQAHTATAMAPMRQEMAAELLEEVLLRKLTKDVSLMLEAIVATESQSALPSGSDGTSVDAMAESGRDGRAGPTDNLLSLLLRCHQEMAVAIVRMGIEVMGYPHTEAVHKALSLCSALVAMVRSNNQLHDIVGHDMLVMAIQALTVESNASLQGDLLNLVRQIYLNLAPVSQTPRQVLKQLPSVTEERLAAMEDGLTKTNSVKEQKQLLKALLLGVGREHLKALASKRLAGTITNVSERSLVGVAGTTNADPSSSSSDAKIGLATIF